MYINLPLLCSSMSKKVDQNGFSNLGKEHVKGNENSKFKT